MSSIKKGQFRKALWETVKDLGAIVLLVVIIRGFILSPYQVSGPSMCPYFNSYHEDIECEDGPGEYIVVSKFWYRFFAPERGDIVVFEKPNSTKGESYIKRIIGLPGDTVSLQDGKVYIFNDEHPNGFSIDESLYLSDLNFNNTQASYGITEFEVPDASYFVMGDNRARSLDSRAYFSNKNPQLTTQALTPFVKKSLISGKAWLVLWPLTQARVIHSAEY